MFVSALTCTGVERSVVVPSPSWPYWLEPHAHTVPLDFTTTVWSQLAPAPTTPLMPTGVGWARSVVVPSPSAPSLLLPNVYTSPSVVTTAVCLWPVATDRTFGTAMGAGSPVMTAGLATPRPSCPELSQPQPHAVPLAVVTNACCPLVSSVTGGGAGTAAAMSAWAMGRARPMPSIAVI